MKTEPRPASELAPDWLAFIEQQNGSNGHEFDLQQLRPGDCLRVITCRTTYDFRMLSHREAILRTSRDDRPSGAVRILGCTFGQSSSIKPDHLFCGGNLKFVFQDGEMTLVTTSIREIHWLRREGEAVTSDPPAEGDGSVSGER